MRIVRLFFSSLKDVDIMSQAEESGDLTNRAFIKAMHAYDMLGEDGQFDVYIGIDDGMKCKNGAVDENSKEVAEKILCQGFLDMGEMITNVRAFVFLDGNGEVLEKFEVEIPFKFMGNPKGIRLCDGGYPLRHVLAPCNGDRPISEMSEEDAFQYYLLFAERNMKEAAAKIAKLADNQS